MKRAAPDAFCLVRANARGFTAIELIIVTAIFSILMLIIGVVWENTLNVWRLQNNFVTVSDELRNAVAVITADLSVAAVEERPSATPPVAGLAISGSPPSQIVFQKPRSDDGLTWSTLSVIRLRNEDLNGNLALDQGEDVNGNGMLDRLIERGQDINGNGSFDDVEMQIIARDVDTLTFIQDGARVNVFVSGRRRGVFQEEDSIPYAERFFVDVAN